RSTSDGIGFSVYADEEGVFFTCIPSVWRMKDHDGDGRADEREAIVRGFGVQVSFIGHDLHGITRGPDGRLYFSVGDRGYHVETPDGAVHNEPCRGAVFRCDSDGSNFEVVARGLRNPQELAFDDYGNLFTFDNTGDIGDVARMVYVLEGTDSGWNMAHQSAHHYVTHLDWGDFHPEKSMWVAERMYDTANEEQPQWVYPPASHVARGPSGVTWLTGESLPEDLRNRFLLANYRGASPVCTVLAVGIEPKGAGYVATSEETVIEGVAASDVELGFDGNIYLCDFGGGWSVNQNGSVQCLVPTDSKLRATGEEVKLLAAQGMGNRSEGELVRLLRHADRRVRHMAQQGLVKRGALKHLEEVAAEVEGPLLPRLHALWGLGQLGREGVSEVRISLMSAMADSEVEVRANAARVLGDLRTVSAVDELALALRDDSLRVRSLAAVALRRVAEVEQGRATRTAVGSLLQAVRENGDQNEPDMVLRHALIGALEKAGTPSTIVPLFVGSVEERLSAVILLRRWESAEVVLFLEDEEGIVRREAIRAIYDTSLADDTAGKSLAALGGEGGQFSTLAEPLQRRVVAANYRVGGMVEAKRLVTLAGHDEALEATREAALKALLHWEQPIETDPVLGTFRPVSTDLASGESNRVALEGVIGKPLQEFLKGEHDPKLMSLAMKLAGQEGIALPSEVLLSQSKNWKLDPSMRISAFQAYLTNEPDREAQVMLVRRLMEDTYPDVRAEALRQAFVLGLPEAVKRAETVLVKGAIPVARAGIAGLAEVKPATLISHWYQREAALRPSLWLDVYEAMAQGSSEIGREVAAAFAQSDPHAVVTLCEEGGNAESGALVFRNQGACMQCHKVGRDGGIQGPALTRVGVRLNREKILESIYNPSAEISKGYGSSMVTKKDGTSVFGRLQKETKDVLEVALVTGDIQIISRGDVTGVTPPISAMPPLGSAIPPSDLRDLVAYLAEQKGGGKGAGSSASHGKADEAIAK
ncbi:MAG: HEAT repeat domain-containing protein, partial [Verrucomicrobiota bacterium]